MISLQQPREPAQVHLSIDLELCIAAFQDFVCRKVRGAVLAAYV
jgi:hypothetical protein